MKNINMIFFSSSYMARLLVKSGEETPVEEARRRREVDDGDRDYDRGRGDHCDRGRGRDGDHGDCDDYDDGDRDRDDDGVGVCGGEYDDVDGGV